MIQKKIVIDCDPGIDDALALFLAFASQEFDIRGITTLAGNVSAVHTARNALSLCTLAGVDIEVASGASHPLSGDECNASDVHGENGLGNVQITPAGHLSSRTAGELLYEELVRAGGELEIIALGPLTNLAVLFETHPDALGLVKKLSLMGGSLGRGNMTPHAEFNFYADPLAADKVLRSGIPIDMYGLDVTNKAILSGQKIEEINSWGGEIIPSLVQMIRFYQNFNLTKGLDGIKLHDPLAVAGALNPGLTEKKPLALGVEHSDKETLGKVLVLEDESLPKNVQVSLTLSMEEFISHFMILLKTYQKQLPL